MKYRSDKNLVQDLFLPYNLTVIALESIQGKVGLELGDMIKGKIQPYVKQYKANSLHKITKRIDQLAHKTITDIIDKRKLSGHKFILLLHSLAELIIAEGVWLPEWIEDIFAPFLEIEHQQVIDEAEWIRLRASAQKQAKKILQKLQGERFFIKNNINSR
jgi:hypothetical protein